MPAQHPIDLSAPASTLEPRTTLSFPNYVQGDLFEDFPTDTPAYNLPATSPATPLPSPVDAAPVTHVSIDGACPRNGRRDAQGGWAVVFADGRELWGTEPATTNIRMEMTAAAVALRATPEGAVVVINTDLELLVKTMNDGWKRRSNLDLWCDLQVLSDARVVTWRWVRGHSGNLGNERANGLAQAAARGSV